MRLRSCNNCNLHQADPPGLKRTNPCTRCAEIDDAAGFYIRWNAKPNEPGAFPITVWRA